MLPVASTSAAKRCRLLWHIHRDDANHDALVHIDLCGIAVQSFQQFSSTLAWCTFVASALASRTCRPNLRTRL
jgi:hypothetical protein